MKTTTVVVIGAGHSGLAMSARLTERSVDHVVLERGEVANSWRSERWDSLRLLTPNCECKLPGWRYDGDDPDGFMAVPEVVAFIDSYAAAINAPVLTGTAVTRVETSSRGYQVTTTGESGAARRWCLPVARRTSPASAASQPLFRSRSKWSPR